ncbi:glucose-1-phosphate thymidylyltransferase [Candidatus Bathyarchaeota archaeon]|jgi:bifunctional UDP-N-acetylglucosamine pyrophosphorylase/glucosamine-1-phosphate N-acetyltransferase|nr:glucose-1-phosphate thymidylyltransferase [Candidatus Bathyarchaeota archaeon]MDP7207581.1 sugar phosphate nucleotidyltransferase [Candidatus Bathyarchaeota archaeon]MDP7442760.1 sugar phosphate nucleotidyltransferase [Candidatus Bathyarchaeota archaeon]|tara:strand:+ start:1367 stop:2641 length:1275 start_codon:yes stop_codon:yes gene_type:complete
MKAVILAAGRGERLRPLTETRPKQLLPVGGLPLLEWSLRGLSEVGINEALIVTHYMEDKIKDQLGDGSRLGISINFAHQDEVKGTAHAFALGKDFVGDDEFIGFYGDGFIAVESFKAVLDAHETGETTLGVIPIDDPSRLAAVELDGDYVIRLLEKPQQGETTSKLANTGIYLFNSEIFDHIRDTGISSRGEYEVTDSIGLLIESGANVKAAILPANGWMDVGHPWDLLEANARALNGLVSSVSGDIEENVSIYGPVHIGKGTRIRSGTYLEGPIYIGACSDIGPNCYIRSYTSIGSGVRIGNACEIKNSIVMDSSHIAHLSYFGDSVIGAGCNFGAGTITANIRFDKKYIKMNLKGSRVNSGCRKFGVVVGDSSQTGINVSLLPGIKVGSEAWVAPGLIVDEDVPSGYFLKKGECVLRNDMES